MNEHHFLTNVGVALAAAVVGGFLARLARLPLLVGYVVAGVVVGPHTPGLFASEETVHAVAKLGVALLMFAVGVQFHLEEMFKVRKIALLGGGAQILGTLLAGWGLGLALGWGHYGGLFVGCALALSSTAVMMRLLEERGELGTAHGTAMLGILVVQDLAVVLMMTVLPALATLSSGGAGALWGVGLSLLRALLLVSLTLFLARKVVPSLLDRVARANSQELFLLVVICVCLGAAYLAQLGGLSLEIGAFLAGLVISESDYAHEVFAEIRPVRDIFSSVFFVSIGMLLNPQVLVRHGAAVAAVVAVILIWKSLLTAVAVYLCGAHGRTAIFTGLGLAQIGEFSFVLASVGSERGLIAPQISDVLLAAALITILLTPLLYGSAPKLYGALNRIPALSRLLNRHGTKEEVLPESVGARVLLLGGGRVGKHVSQALSAREISHVVVDYDAEVVARLRAAHIPVVYGDATSEIVLARATPPSVELAIVALPEASLSPIVVRLLRKHRPELPVIARVHHGVSIPRLRAAGADEVVHAEFEASTEIIRHTLAHLSVPPDDTNTYLQQIRAFRYRRE